jgi:hypothetical protein
MDVQTLTSDFVDEARGRRHRADPALPRTGGPAANARLTAWTGLVLLVLFLAELVTLLDLRGLVAWHITIGVLLIPPALVKTATTGWRIVRYYAGNPAYRTAGPPTLLLRLLGPVVVVTTLGVLGTGVALVAVGPARSRDGVSLIGHTIDLTTLHKAFFVLWAFATGVHTLGRLWPAVRLTVAPDRPRVAGVGGRATVAVLAVAAAVAGAILAASTIPAWSNDRPYDRPGHHRYR